MTPRGIKTAPLAQWSGVFACGAETVPVLELTISGPRHSGVCAPSFLSETPSGPPPVKRACE